MAMKTPEQIAREAAERLVRVEKMAPYSASSRVLLGELQIIYNDDIPFLENRWLHPLRKELYSILLAAIEAALCQCPVPSPVSDERLEEIDERITDLLRAYSPNQPSPSSNLKSLVDQRQHINHLHRVFAGPEAADYQNGYDDGYKRGLEEGRKSWSKEDEYERGYRDGRREANSSWGALDL